MTEKERAYLKRLRWRSRRPALLLAIRFKNGKYFHVLKLITYYL